MANREFDEGTIPGSDVEINLYEDLQPIPQSPPGSLSGPWLRKTDWSIDGIIANGQQ